MTPNANLTALRDALAQPPSEGAWREICAVLETLGDDSDALPVALDYAAAHLDSWPAELQLAPRRWVGPSAPGWPVVRALDLSRTHLRDSDLGELVAAGALDGVEHLDLSDNHLTASAAATLASCEGLSELRALNLSNNDLTTRGAVTLSRPRAMRHLTHLELSRAQISADGVAAICNGPLAASLERLDLSHNRLGLDGVASVAASNLGRLRELDLRDNQLEQVGDKAIGALSAAAHLEALERLSLGDLTLTEEGARRLGGASWARGVRRLELYRASLQSPATVTALLEGGWESLEHLGLDACGLEPAHLDHLPRRAGLERLRSLSLDHNRLGVEGAVSLSAWSRLGQVESLSLFAANLRVGGARALAGADLSSMTTIVLGRDNRIADAGLAAILDNPTSTRVVDLNLANAELTQESCQRLASRPLRRLVLSGNRVDDEGLRALLEGKAGETLRSLSASAVGVEQDPFGGARCGMGLRELDLSCNQLSNAAVSTLLEVARPELTALDLRFNRLSGLGVDPFSRAPGAAPLRRLDLSDNRLGDEGARRLARASSLRQLAALQLRNVGIGNRGLRALMDSARLSALERLNVAGNEIGIGGVRAISTRVGLPRLDRVKLDGNRVPGRVLSLMARATRRETRARIGY